MLDTWSCHICKRIRPDENISVKSTVRMFHNAELVENVRYCNDNPDCKKKAQTFSHFSQFREE